MEGVDIPTLPFLTYISRSPDMSDEDFQRECELLFRRQKAIDEFIRGDVADDHLLDLLAEDGIDPYEWLETSADNCLYLAGF